MKEDKWINIEDKLPNFYNGVFVYCSDDYITVAFAIEGDGIFQGFKYCTYDDYYIKYVTHWQPINYPNKPNKTK